MNHEEIGSGWRKNHSNSNCNNTNLPRKNLCDFLELKTLYPLRWTMRAAITKYCAIELASRLLCIGFVQMKRWANEGSVCRTQGLVDPIKDPFPLGFLYFLVFLLLDLLDFELRTFGWLPNSHLQRSEISLLGFGSVVGHVSTLDLGQVDFLLLLRG